MTTKFTELIRKRMNFQLALFIFMFQGSYIASYLFFNLPLVIPTNLFSLFIISVAIPSLVFFSRWAGKKNTFIIISILVLLVLFVEGIGVLTGFPYGHFFYSDLMGIKIFGLVPWAVPFAFIPLTLGTITIATQYVQKSWKIILLSASLLVIVDLVIDPILVYLGIWIWLIPGFYYGVPISNFIGWFITGLIASSILLIFFRLRVRAAPRMPMLVTLSLFLTLAFWSGFAFWANLIIPFIISVFLLGFFLISYLGHFLVES